jgi:hypothetical protein
MSLSKLNEIQPYAANHAFLISDGTGQQVLASPTDRFVSIDEIFVVNTDGIPHVVNVGVGAGGPYAIISVTVPSGAGAGGVAPVALLAVGLPSTIPNLTVDKGQYLQLWLEVAVVTDQAVQATAVGGYLPS